VSGAPDVAVIGGGIVGCALAAFLAEGGARVRLYERDRLAAGASGRNSGLLQHPLDEALLPLYTESLGHYGELGHGFALPDEPSGLLYVAADRALVAAEHAQLVARFPELAPQWFEEATAAEPAVAPGLAATRLDTGRPVPPAAATAAFAARARAAGAQLREGAPATVAVHTGRVAGVDVDGALEPAGAVAVAAGPWTPDALGGAAAAPVRPVWGAIAEVRLERPPQHAVEEAGAAAAISTPGAPPSLFTIVTAGGVSAVGSTFRADQPDPSALAPVLLARGTRFVPGLEGVGPQAVRACARPQSADGRPLLGPVPGVAGLALATGHGPWGITLGPASARLVADGLLGRTPAVPPALTAGR
jgi:glycine/D-amino acid oxidase-like deaminating enzyme